MCLGIPGQVMSFSDISEDIATVDVSGVTRNVNVGLVRADGLEVGDWVLIHVGFAMSIIDEEEAKLSLGALELMGEEFEAEMDELARSRIE